MTPTWTVTNIRPQKSVRGFHLFDASTEHILGLAFFIIGGRIDTEEFTDVETNTTLSEPAARALYRALVLAAPDGLVLLPEDEAIKPLLYKETA